MPPGETRLGIQEVSLNAKQTFESEADARAAFDTVQKVVTGSEFPIPLAPPQDEVHVGFSGPAHDHTNKGTVFLHEDSVKLSVEFSGEAQQVFEQAIDLLLDEIGFLTVDVLNVRCILTAAFESLEGVEVEAEYPVDGVKLVVEEKEFIFEGGNGGETQVRVTTQSPFSVQAPVGEEIHDELEDVVEVVSDLAPGGPPGNGSRSHL